jgi:hypothetical protein
MHFRRHNLKYYNWYSMVQHFWPAEKLAELADRPTACDDVTCGVYLLGPSVSVNCVEQGISRGREEKAKHDRLSISDSCLA